MYVSMYVCLWGEGKLDLTANIQQDICVKEIGL